MNESYWLNETQIHKERENENEGGRGWRKECEYEMSTPVAHTMQSNRSADQLPKMNYHLYYLFCQTKLDSLYEFICKTILKMIETQIQLIN